VVADEGLDLHGTSSALLPQRSPQRGYIPPQQFLGVVVSSDHLAGNHSLYPHPKPNSSFMALTPLLKFSFFFSLQ
jgi:hypothetical protein